MTEAAALAILSVTLESAIIVFVIGLILAFPLAVAICAFLGGMFIAVDRLITRCPVCHARSMRTANAIRETYPTAVGTGRFYVCRACGKRSFWSNDSREWKDASDSAFDWAYR